MKLKYGVMIPLLLIFLSSCATTTTTETKEGWYPNIVEYDYVSKRAELPKPDDVLIIDSRPKARKYDEGHIPGAASIPETQFDKMTDQLPKDKSTLLIFYCGGVKCMLSHKSAFKAEKLGYSNIKVYAEGYPDWVKQGGMVAVDVAHIKKLIDSKANMVLIDSRPTKRKYDQGHIPGAISIPDSEFDKLTAKLPKDKATPLYFYCGGLKCKLSSDSADKAVKLGYNNVHVVPGGYPAWKQAYGTKAASKPPAIKTGKQSGSISAASFQEIMQSAPESLYLVDVRDAKEFASGSIKGAVNIPINDLEDKMASLPKNKTIVFFCGTGGRAGEAYDMIQMFMPQLKTYFIDAEIEFNKDGSYTITKAG